MSSTDEDLGDREARDVALQEVIDGLVRLDRPWTVDSAAEELRTRIADRGLPEPAPTWVTAVAEGVVRGEAYVVSKATRRDEDVPAPPRHLDYPVID